MNTRKGSASKNKKNKKQEPKEQRTYVDHELEPVEVRRIPADQLQLSESEMKEEFTKSLTAVNPSKPERVTHFNFKSGEFESRPNESHLAIHFSVDGIIRHQNEVEEQEAEVAPAETQEQQENTEENENDEEHEATEVEQETEENPEDGATATVQSSATSATATREQSPTKKDQRLVKNQFNYSERASQTFNQPMRDREVMTEPAPTATFSHNATAYAIYDEYLNNLMRSRQIRETKPTSKKSAKKKEEENKIVYTDENDAILNSAEMTRATQIMERVVHQNSDQAIYHDFRYFKEEDYKSDPFLLPLWTFRYNDARHKSVTCLCWNHAHQDLFAVGFGSYDFMHQTSGLIAVFSLKSTHHPYKVIRVESGVMCTHFHPQHPSLLCVGAYDGSVAVYDIRNSDDTPIYSSENPENYHKDPVWDVRWHTTDLGHELNFFSISSDGRVANWTMSKNELVQDVLMELKLNEAENDTPVREEDATILGLAPGSCFDFNPFMEHVFLVGTEDGVIHQCSKVYLNGYLKSYRGHQMNVYAVRWSPFHSRTFLSCSHDWTLKLWDSDEDEPIMSYDMNTPVGDVRWAPFSSTIFACCTTDGKVHVFDLEQNKNGPVCSQRVTKKGSLTHVSFGPKDPVIVAGDDRGVAHCLKLSPHLCKSNAVGGDWTTLDISKEGDRLEKILQVTGSKVLDLSIRRAPLEEQDGNTN